MVTFFASAFLGSVPEPRCFLRKLPGVPRCPYLFTLLVFLVSSVFPCRFRLLRGGTAYQVLRPLHAFINLHKTADHVHAPFSPRLAFGVSTLGKQSLSEIRQILKPQATTTESSKSWKVFLWSNSKRYKAKEYQSDQTLKNLHAIFFFFIKA